MSAPAGPEPAEAARTWCADCKQSVSNSRLASHRVSKKHLDRAMAPPASAPHAAPAAGTSPLPASAPIAVPGSAVPGGEPPRARKTSARPLEGLPRDPNKEGHFWCGICGVSLTAAKAVGHLETSRHRENSKKHLSSAIKQTKPHT